MRLHLKLVNWRDEMPQVREIARSLASDGKIEILSKGQPIPSPFELKGLGPIRLRIVAAEEDTQESEK